MKAFHHGLLNPTDPAMNDPARYTTQTLHVAMAQVRGTPTSLSSFLALPAVQVSPGRGTQTVTLAVFQPPQHAASPPNTSIATTPSTAVPISAAPRIEGETCPVCGDRVQWRRLFTGQYLGCRC